MQNEIKNEIKQQNTGIFFLTLNSIYTRGNTCYFSVDNGLYRTNHKMYIDLKENKFYIDDVVLSKFVNKTLTDLKFIIEYNQFCSMFSDGYYKKYGVRLSNAFSVWTFKDFKNTIVDEFHNTNPQYDKKTLLQYFDSEFWTSLGAKENLHLTNHLFMLISFDLDFYFNNFINQIDTNISLN